MPEELDRVVGGAQEALLRQPACANGIAETIQNGPVPVQMWDGVSPVPAQMWQG